MMPNRRLAGARRLDLSTSADEVRTIHLEDVARARALIAGTDHPALADLFGALADPTRLAIVEILVTQEMCTADLAATLRMSEPAVSQHLRILRVLGIATSRRAGRMVYYAVGDRSVGRLVDIARRRRRTAHRTDFEGAGPT